MIFLTPNQKAFQEQIDRLQKWVNYAEKQGLTFAEDFLKAPARISKEYLKTLSKMGKYDVLGEAYTKTGEKYATTEEYQEKQEREFINRSQGSKKSWAKRQGDHEERIDFEIIDTVNADLTTLMHRATADLLIKLINEYYESWGHEIIENYKQAKNETTAAYWQMIYASDEETLRAGAIDYLAAFIGELEASEYEADFDVTARKDIYALISKNSALYKEEFYE